MNSSSISQSGMQASMARLTANASNIANAQSPGYKPVQATQSALASGGVTARIEASGAATVDLSDEMVGMLVAKIAFQANARALEAAHNLERGVLNTLA